MGTLFLGHNYLDRKQKRLFTVFGICIFIFFIAGILYLSIKETESRNIIFKNSIAGKVQSLSNNINEIEFKIENDDSIYYLNRITSNNCYTFKYIGRYLKVGSLIAKESNSSFITIDDSLVFNINKKIEAE